MDIETLEQQIRSSAVDLTYSGSIYLQELPIHKFPDLSDISVEGDVICRASPLNSLKGFPKSIKGDVDISENRLTSLEYCSEIVGGCFYCNGNRFLTSLKGVPKCINSTFDCSSNLMKTLIGGPEYVGGDYICFLNDLTSLCGAPEFVGGDFRCSINTNLKTLTGLPKHIGGKFVIDKTTWDELPKDTNEAMYIILNDKLEFI